MSDSQKNISYSSVETQRNLRIEKLNKFKELGHDPYTPNSKRDYTLGFIKFWFDFVHKFDITKVIEEDENYLLDYFLDQVLFPQSLVEKMEEKLHIRNMVKESGMDPEESHFEEEFDSAIVNEARALLPNFLKYSEEERTKLKSQIFNKLNDDEDESYELIIKPNQYVTLAGRIKAKRVSGKIAFATTEDESCPEGFQFIFKKDTLDEKNNSVIEYQGEKKQALTFDNFKDLFDEGDYIQAYGYLDYSQRGEPSMFVEQFEILTKAIRPLPDQLEYENVEARYLDRVADFKMNTKDENGLSTRDIVRYKSNYWNIWREEMIKEGFLEVECPIFETIPGGADAKPFTTFYNELDQDMYLRISLELPLKKLIAGGFEKVFEIGRQFRNEGSDPTHLQEYTQIEWYWAYSNYYDAMPFTVRIYRRIVQEILGKLEQIDYYGNTINWGGWCGAAEAKKNGWKLIDGWPAIPYFDAVRYFTNGEVDLENKNYDQLIELAKKHNIETEEGVGYANLMDKIFKKTARQNMINPIFLIEQPVELEPLAKRDPRNPKLIHRWQIVAGTAELGKAFSELNDPIDQLERFQEQQAARDAGDPEAQFMNMDYVKALEYGLPPLSGFGMSERFVSFLLGKHIRETVTFPHIRTQENTAIVKSKQTKVAHAVLYSGSEIPLWSKLNAAAHLSASLGAREGKKLIWIDNTKTTDGEQIPMNIQHAIIMKETKDRNLLLELKKEADKLELEVTCFTEEMRDSSNDAKVKEWQEGKKAEDIGWLGVMVFGEKKKVEELTKKFKLAE